MSSGGGKVKDPQTRGGSGERQTSDTLGEYGQEKHTNKQIPALTKTQQPKAGKEQGARHTVVSQMQLYCQNGIPAQGPRGGV